MSQKIELEVSEEAVGQRLDLFLSQHPEVGSRSKASKLISQGLVTGSQSKLKASTKVEAGEKYVIEMPKPESSEIEKLDLELDIVFEDDDVIVVNKPSGLVVHPATSHQNDTLVNALVAHTDQLSMGVGEKRPGIVHRLDRDTSGLLVIAKNDSAHRHLADQFKARTVHRLYWAIAYGELPDNEMRFESHIARHPTNRQKMASTDEKHGKIAITNAKQITYGKGVCLVRLKLETGRTHQIRVHLSENHHPIIGDETYGSKGRDKNLKSLKLRGMIARMGRFALHAAELGFAHPRTEKWMAFQKDWPEDLLEVVEFCEFPSPFASIESNDSDSTD